MTPEFVKPGATVIDVGINRVTDRARRRDALRPVRRGSRTSSGAGPWSSATCIPRVAEVAGALTPVPGGVGPLTIAMLLKNTVTAARGRVARAAPDA